MNQVVIIQIYFFGGRSLEIHFPISIMHKKKRIIWNNKDTRIDNRSVFYKLYYENGIVYIRDLLLEFDNKQSHDFYTKGS